MSPTKEFVLPLVPFFIDLVIKIGTIWDRDWWYYVDSSTLLLTFSVWSTLFLARVPKKTNIPKDREVLASYDALRHKITIYVMIGFALYGIITYVKVLVDRSKGTVPDVTRSDQEFFSIATIVFCISCGIFIFQNRLAISKMIEA